MSVTFYPQKFDPDGNVVWDSGRMTEINLANGNARDLLMLLGYTRQATPDEFADLEGGDELYAALRHPGVDGGQAVDLYGEADPDDFLGRILTARALLDTATDDAAGKPTVEVDEPGRARLVLCGRRPGYMAEKLAELEAIAGAAKTHAALVVWA